jgi:2-methylcitrate dehydratase PrpD
MTTQAIAKWASTLLFSQLPDEAIEKAKACILDTCGVILAGTTVDPAQIVADYARLRSSRPIASALGWGTRLEPNLAAMLNGTCGHALDFDDTNYSIIGHSSVVVLPAVLAAAEETRAAGRDVIAAFVTGTEVACKLGAAVNPLSFDAGWFTTGSVGVFGAAAGCAHVWRLTEQQVASALGIAAAHAAGTRGNNGTIAKPYQAGRAAQAGVVAAEFARAGLTASPAIFENQDGYFQVYNNRQVNLDPLRHLGNPYDLVSPGMMVKQYPACSATAAALNAIFAILAKHPLTWSDVRAVDCDVTPLVHISLPYTTPQTGLQGKFSLHFCLAAAILHGQIDITTFDDRVVQDQRIKALMRRITVRKRDATDGPPFSSSGPESATVTVRTVDGQTFSKHVDYPAGSPQRPLSSEELRNKFYRCARDRIPANAAERIIASLDTLEQVEDLEPVMQLLRGGSARAAAITERRS